MADARAAQKEQFVREWIRFSDPFKAAHAVFPLDSAAAVAAVSEWQFDVGVLTRRDQILKEEGDEGFLPSKAELARMALALAAETTDRGNFRHTGRERVQALELAGRLLGYVEKPATPSNQNGSKQRPVIILAERAE